jgi:three-Cys-motif partner protein
LTTKKAIEDPDYDIVKLHSKQKHAFLKGYLRIWTENVAANKGEAAPQLQLFDLFAGTGECKEEYTGETWKGSAVLLAECLHAYTSKWPCVLYVNSYNEDGEHQERQLAKVKERVTAAGLPAPKRDVHFGADKVATAAEKARPYLNADYPSLWILDPWRPQHLPWEVVETVANYRGEHYERRPELLINLMTYQLQQNIDNAPHILSTALGMPESEWRPQIETLQEGGLNTRQAIVQLYGERLTKLYGREPWVIDVPGIDGNIVYVLFLCLERDAAFHSVRKILLPAYEKWKAEKFKPRAQGVSANRSVDRKAGKAGHKQDRLF